MSTILWKKESKLNFLPFFFFFLICIYLWIVERRNTLSLGDTRLQICSGRKTAASSQTCSQRAIVVGGLLSFLTTSAKFASHWTSTSMKCWYTENSQSQGARGVKRKSILVFCGALRIALSRSAWFFTLTRIRFFIFLYFLATAQLPVNKTMTLSAYKVVVNNVQAD